MKKLLTVLLVIAVMFTFSFGSAMATTYTLDDYATALTAEKTAQLGYINSVKTQYVNSLTYDDDGFATVKGTKYMKAALEAAADEVIADADKAMKAAIDSILNSFEDTTTAPDKSVVANVAAHYNTVAVFGPLVEAKTDTLNKTQAPLTKKFVQEKVTVDLSKYNSTDKTELVDGVKITKAQYVQKLMDDANDAIAAADKESTDDAKMNGYWTAYNTFKTAFDAVKTLDDEKYEEEIGAGTVEAAVEAYAKAALEAVDAQLNSAFETGKSLANMAADDTVDFSALVGTGALKPFWEANKTNANKGELFGAAVANIKKVTRTEVVAIVNGYKAAVAASKPAVKAFADGNAAKLNLTDPNPTALELLARASDAVEAYADVTKLAGKYKAAYVEGVKVYDDASVDTALKAAEQLVYDDMATGTFKTAAQYLEAAADAENVTLEAQNYEYEKFMKAVEDAAKKFFKDGTEATEVQVKVSYGDDKTAEADLVYLKGTYASGAQGQDKWTKIAKDTIRDLRDAQSYDEIKTIMAKAAEDLGKLLKADDKADVEKARNDYKGALANYKNLKLSLVDTNVYPEATLEAARAQGEELIDKAVTVDAVKAAYEEAKALIDNVKTQDELKAAKEALEKQISELPYTAKLTVADKAAVKAAYDAYHAFTKMAGADVRGISSSVTLLQQKYDKVNELVAEEIDAKAKAINEKLDDLATNSDADIAAKVALKAEAEAILAEAEALTDEIEAVNEDHDGFLNDVNMAEVVDLDEVDFSAAVAADASRKLTKAGKEGATFEEMKEALDAYNALTDKQKYQLDAKALPLIKVLEQKLGMTVKSLKITAKSTAKKGSITVKWTVKGEADIDGFEVWKSTKHSKGYKKAFTTTKKTYKNSKGLKKGSRYYYKVRAYKVIDGVKVTSDWSNKARRVAK